MCYNDMRSDVFHSSRRASGSKWLANPCFPPLGYLIRLLHHSPDDLRIIVIRITKVLTSQDISQISSRLSNEEVFARSTGVWSEQFSLVDVQVPSSLSRSPESPPCYCLEVSLEDYSSNCVFQPLSHLQRTVEEPLELNKSIAQYRFIDLPPSHNIFFNDFSIPNLHICSISAFVYGELRSAHYLSIVRSFTNVDDRTLRRPVSSKNLTVPSGSPRRCGSKRGRGRRVSANESKHDCCDDSEDRGY